MDTILLSAVPREKTLFTPEAHNDFLWAVVGSPWGLLAVWLVLINAVTFCVFGVDKWKAKRKEKKSSVRRVPEKTLLILSAIGGSVGALLAMRAFHPVRRAADPGPPDRHPLRALAVHERHPLKRGGPRDGARRFAVPCQIWQGGSLVFSSLFVYNGDISTKEGPL